MRVVENFLGEIMLQQRLIQAIKGTKKLFGLTFILNDENNDLI